MTTGTSLGDMVPKAAKPNKGREQRPKRVGTQMPQSPSKGQGPNWAQIERRGNVIEVWPLNLMNAKESLNQNFLISIE